MANYTYRTGELSRHYSVNRIAWDQFCEPERTVIDRLNPERDTTLLDVGCGCGGLGLALRDRFSISDYTGVEINEQAAEKARAMNPEARILCGDIVDVSEEALAGRLFDIVFSLSCIDWNVDYSQMLAAAWAAVRPGGHLVATFRLTVDDGCNDPDRSYQYINSSGSMAGERAPYVVMNASLLLDDLQALGPSQIDVFGYWGKPSTTAVTLYQALFFAAISMRKRHAGDTTPTARRLDLRPDMLNALEASRR